MMSEHDFDLRLRHIEDQFAAREESALAFRDQELARLFVECGWTQERIAARVGKKQAWVSNRLRFGRFIQLYYNCNKSEKALGNVTEGRFRACWAKTKGNERERFAQAGKLLEGDVPPNYRNLERKPGYRQAVADSCLDGRWHNVRQLVSELDRDFPGITHEQVSSAVQSLQRKPPKGLAVESRHIGRLHQYRLVKRGAIESGSPDAAALAEHILPIVREIKGELRKSLAAMSSAFMLERLHAIEQALSRLCQKAGAV
jgi:hypothetical protein